MGSNNNLALQQQTTSEPASKTSDGIFASAFKSYRSSATNTNPTEGGCALPTSWQRLTRQPKGVALEIIEDAKKYMSTDVRIAVDKAIEKSREEQSLNAFEDKQRQAAPYCKRVVSEAVHNLLLQRVPMTREDIDLLDSVQEEVERLTERPWMLVVETWV